MVDWSIQKLYDFGYFYSPDALQLDLVEESDLELLRPDDQIVVEAARRWQMNFSEQMYLMAATYHGRTSIDNGVLGPATRASLLQPRCGVPDYYSPMAALEEANWPEACRMEITTSYKMSLSGLTDSELARLWQEADMNWEREFEIHFEFRPQDYPNTRIFSFEASLGGSVLADQYLANNNCGFRAQGRFDSRTWSHALFVTTCTHEHGHALGLPHTPNDQSSTMYPSVTNASMSRRGKPNDTDIKNMISRGYTRRTTPLPPTPPDGPTPEPPGDNKWYFTGTTIRHNPSGDSVKCRIIEDSGFAS